MEEPRTCNYLHGTCIVGSMKTRLKVTSSNRHSNRSWHRMTMSNIGQVLGFETLSLAKRRRVQFVPKCSPIFCINTFYSWRYRLTINNFGLNLPSCLWQWYQRTIDNGRGIRALNIVLQTLPVWILVERIVHVRFAMWTSLPNIELSPYISACNGSVK